MTILMFPKCVKVATKVEQKKELTYKEAQEQLLADWVGRNQVISDEFCLYNAYQKQVILDTILDMNSELYKIIIEMKGKVE